MTPEVLYSVSPLEDGNTLSVLNWNSLRYCEDAGVAVATSTTATHRPTTFLVKVFIAASSLALRLL
jgi:hypothetical protein